MISKLFAQLIKHKIAASMILLVVAGGGYLGYSKIFSDDGAIRYATTQVQKGTLIVSTTGSGQVSSSDQVDIMSKVSGEVAFVGIKVGQEVRQGQTMFILDDANAKETIADAELDLEETKLKLDKDIAQAPIDYERELEALKKTKDDLAKEYEDTFGTLSDAFLSLPSAITGIQGVLFNTGLEKSTNQQNISVYKNLFYADVDRLLVISLADIAEKDYRIAREAYDKTFLSFKGISLYAEPSVLEALLEETLATTKAMAQAAKSEANLLDAIVDIAERKNVNLVSQITSFQSSARSYLSTANSNLSSVLAQKRSIEDAKQSIANAERDVEIFTINNPTGIIPVDLQIAQNNIKKKEEALADLKTELQDFTILAPFTGIITKVNVKAGDTASTSTALATLATKQKIAQITLNEIDIAYVKVGQKATLTFDAVPDLTITGQIAEVDAGGTVSQGVVTYGVKITFDTEDERVKTEMTASAAIVTEAKPNVVLVPNPAVKSQSEINYVEIPDESDMPIATANVSGAIFGNPIRQQQVEIGLSNDELTEIVSGLNAGDIVVTRTIQPTTQTTQTQQQNSSLRIPGLNTGGTGGFRTR